MNLTPSWTATVATARSFLFVPANRPERYAKALASNADAVVLDLEDSVPTEDKALARDAIARAWPGLRASSKPVVLRINPPSSAAGETDLGWLSSLRLSTVVMVAKADNAETLKTVQTASSETPVLPLIESAEGYARLSEIAAEPHVVRLVVGHIDFMVDTGIQCSDEQRELDALRFAVAIQTRRFQLATPVDGVTLDVDNEPLLRADTQRAVRFGFGAKLCIHPKQVDSVHDALLPSERDVRWARRVIESSEAAGGTAFKLDGRMIDIPVVLQAQKILARLEQHVQHG